MQSYSSGYRSPSNIAIVKYWGKYGKQLPRNPSISLTLSAAYSDTRVTATPSSGSGVSLDFRFEGNANEAFTQKLNKLLTGILPEMPFLNDFHLSIDSSNSFPHSAGIASSASAMSALSLCLCDIRQQASGKTLTQEEYLRQSSDIARLLSGSACRSVYGGAAVWGKTSALEGSADEFAVPVELHPLFRSFHDDILIISSKEKEVSSTAGHELMNTNPYAETRFHEAGENLAHLLPALQAGDIETFGAIAENEALTLHALMMTSSPPYLLLLPPSLKAIQMLWDFRRDTRIPVYFTIDAGPNIHVLYPDEYATQVGAFIRDELSTVCENGKVIHDRVGDGPEKS